MNSDNDNINILKRIEKEFKREIIGQDEAINRVMDVIAELS